MGASGKLILLDLLLGDPESPHSLFANVGWEAPDRAVGAPHCGGARNSTLMPDDRKSQKYPRI